MSRLRDYAVARARQRRSTAAVVDVAANLIALRQGLMCAKRLPPTTAPPVHRDAGDLERYFDANADGPGIWKWRHYFDIYERHFARFRGREVHVVEVGVYSGGSLGMWRHYFGDHCHVYGVDIEPACRAYAGDNVEVHVGDQADPSFWREFRRRVPRVDILIDDGGHETEMQITTLEQMLPHIAPGGVYLCEDIHGPTNAFNGYLDGLTRSLAAVGDYVHSEPTPAQQHIASIHRYPIAAVIEKPPGRIPAFEAPRHGTIWEPILDHYSPPDPSFSAAPSVL